MWFLSLGSRVREFYLLITFTAPAKPLKIHEKRNPGTLADEKLFLEVIAYVKLYLRIRMFLRSRNTKVEQTFMNFKSDDWAGADPFTYLRCIYRR